MNSTDTSSIPTDTENTDPNFPNTSQENAKENLCARALQERDGILNRLPPQNEPPTITPNNLAPPLEIARAEISSLKIQLNEEKKRSEEVLQKFSSENSALQTEVDGLVAQVGGLRTERDSLKTEFGGLTAQVDGLKTERDSLKTEVGGFAAQIHGLETERDSLKTEVSGLAAQVHGLDTERDSLKTEVDGLAAQVRGLETEQVSHQTQVNGLEAQVHQLEYKCRELERDVKNMETELGEEPGTVEKAPAHDPDPELAKQETESDLKQEPVEEHTRGEDHAESASDGVSAEDTSGDVVMSVAPPLEKQSDTSPNPEPRLDPEPEPPAKTESSTADGGESDAKMKTENKALKDQVQTLNEQMKAMQAQVNDTRQRRTPNQRKPAQKGSPMKISPVKISSPRKQNLGSVREKTRTSENRSVTSTKRSGVQNTTKRLSTPGTSDNVARKLQFPRKRLIELKTPVPEARKQKMPRTASSVPKNIPRPQRRLTAPGRLTIAQKSEPQFKDVEIDGSTNIKEETAKAFLLLKNTQTEWNDRVQAMKTLDAIFRYKNSLTKDECDHLKSCLDSQIKELRSGVVSEACTLLVTMADVLGSSFSPYLGFYVEILFTQVSNSTKAIREPAENALQGIIASSRNMLCIKQLLSGSRSSSSYVRRQAVKHIGTIINITMEGGSAPSRSGENDRNDDESKVAEKKRGYVGKIGSHRTAIEKAIKQCLGDRDEMVRADAVVCFESYRKRWKKKSEGFLSSLGESDRKLIMRKKKKPTERVPLSHRPKATSHPAKSSR